MTKNEIIRKHKEYLFNCVTTYYKDPLVIGPVEESTGAIAQPGRRML